MISFKDFLSEDKVVAWKVKELSLKKIINMLNAECSDGLKAIHNGSILYRGFSKGRKEASGFQFIDTTKAERTSRDTNNLYQLMMDNSEALKGYPKRKNSLICATRLDTADGYGHLRIIIPFNGTKVAALDSYSDIFNIHLKSPIYKKGVRDLCNDVEGVLSDMYFPDDDRYDNIGKINNFLAKKSITDVIDEFVHSADSGANRALIEKTLKAAPKNERFTALSTLVMTPESIGVQLYTYGDVLPVQKKVGVEAWFSGKALSMDLDIFCDILVKLEKEQDFTIGAAIKQDVKSAFNDALDRYDSAHEKKSLKKSKGKNDDLYDF